MDGTENKWRETIYRRRMAFMLVVSRQDSFRKDFMYWLSRNWHVWLAFEREANKVWESGRRHYSARTIGEFLRHQTAVRERDGEGWKINDHYWPDLARLYMLMYPDRLGFFERRTGPLSQRTS